MSVVRETMFSCIRVLMHPQATVDRARQLSQQGLIDREVALIVGVPLSAVRKSRTGARRAPDTEHRAGCPRCDGGPLDETAYSYLLGLYLGDGCISRGGARTKDVWKLSIACADAWPGLIQECGRAIRAVRPANKVPMVQRLGCTEVKSYSRHWPCLFPQHGPGKKHLRKIELAEWQQVIVERYPGEFARGLLHSDGCRTLNRSGTRSRAGSAGTSTRGICSSMSPRTSCGCAARRWTSWGWSGGSRSPTRSRWRSGTRWRGWTSSSGRSTNPAAGGASPRGRSSARSRRPSGSGRRHGAARSGGGGSRSR